ncbi:hypothetical protein CB1_001073063 [Camelus ferus]|nr:hypothetical protein CB1_001073063 [Camelus ferus]
MRAHVAFLPGPQGLSHRVFKQTLVPAETRKQNAQAPFVQLGVEDEGADGTRKLSHGDPQPDLSQSSACRLLASVKCLPPHPPPPPRHLHGKLRF